MNSNGPEGEHRGGGFRAFALSQIDPSTQPLPQNPTVAFVWPTELCGIGCAHCSFGSVRSGDPEDSALAQHPEALVDWLVMAGARKFVACGGGEPLDEPEFLERSIAACAAAGLPFEIYTSGVATMAPRPPSHYIETWKAAFSGAAIENVFRIRLSVDHFHEERLGLEPLVEWIRETEQLAPEWVLGFRSLRLENDDSIKRLAAMLNGTLIIKSERSGRILLPSGRIILVEWKGFVFEHRGQLQVLKKRGLRFTDRDALLVDQLEKTHGAHTDFGRPLSAPLTVSRHLLDLEIHANCVVHILESQPPDRRLTFTDNSWPATRNHYFRDPILHRIVEGGLPAIADLIAEALRQGINRERVVPYSVERLQDPELLDFITANAIVSNSPRFVYPEELRLLARDFLSLTREDRLEWVSN